MLEEDGERHWGVNVLHTNEVMMEICSNRSKASCQKWIHYFKQQEKLEIEVWKTFHDIFMTNKIEYNKTQYYYM